MNIFWNNITDNTKYVNYLDFDTKSTGIFHFLKFQSIINFQNIYKISYL